MLKKKKWVISMKDIRRIIDSLGSLTSGATRIIIFSVVGINILMIVGFLWFEIQALGISPNDRQHSPHELHNLDIDVHIEDSGVAYITETWDMSIVDGDGTEVYKPFTLEQNQGLTNFKVSMNNEPFMGTSFWDATGSREDKANSFAIYNNEMVWGMTESGRNTYVLEYAITNFVTQTDTDQMIYWGFINDSMDPAPKSASVTITADNALSVDDNLIWGFGYDGFTEIVDNTARWWTDTPMTPSNYLVAMLKLEGSAYTTSYYRPGTFDSWVQDAFIDSDYSYDDYMYGLDNTISQRDSVPSRKNKVSILEQLTPTLFMLGFVLIWGGVFITGIRKSIFTKRYYPNLRALSRSLSGEYYRGDVLDDVFVHTTLLESLDIQNLDSHLIHTAILYLIRDEAISVREIDDDLFIRFTGKRSKNQHAQSFMRILEKNTSNKDKMNLTQTMRVMNWREIDAWLTQIRRQSKTYMKANNYVKDVDKKGVPKSRYIADKAMGMHLTDSGMNLRDDHVRYRNYLKDFSVISERSHNEVLLWDRMMLYASAYGIADEFAEEIGKIPIPDETIHQNAGYIRMSHSQRFNNQRLYRDVRRAHSRNSSRGSSGGGGRSSSGGGRSGGGRSSGGGTR